MNVLVNVENRSPQEQRTYYNKLFNLYETLHEPLQDLDLLYNNLEFYKSELAKNKKWLSFKWYLLIFFLTYVLSFILFASIASRINIAFDEVISIAVLSGLIVGLAIYIFINTYIRKRTCDKIQLKIDETYTDINELFTLNAEKLQFIPDGYFSYDAIKYFTQAYNVGKVSNLKEAMQSYDLYLHHQRMEMSQQQILAQQEQINRQQQQLAKNVTSARRELAFDTAMLFLSRF